MEFRKSFKKLARLTAKQWASLFIAVVFLCNTILPNAVFAAEVFGLPSPAQFVNLSENYSFPVLKGLKFDPNKPLTMEFIIDTGSQKKVSKEEASRLIRYFLTGLTVPPENLWVNLSPYEKDRILPDVLTSTELGEGLLSQDYILKQISASLTYPESSTGKDFWTKTYQEVLKIAKTTNIPVNTFNKIWIVPDKAVVYENKNLAVVSEASLKAMLEEDYLSLDNNLAKIQKEIPQRNTHNAIRNTRNLIQEINKASSNVMREQILPKINQDINNGKNFATLRQICHSLILAGWFKKKFKDSLYKHYLDQAKLKGIDVSDKEAREKVYNLYLSAFTKGLYNYIKPEKELATKKNIKRRYYSGGIAGFDVTNSPVIIKHSNEVIAGALFNNNAVVQVTTKTGPLMSTDTTNQHSITAGSAITAKNINFKEELNQILPKKMPNSPSLDLPAVINIPIKIKDTEYQIPYYTEKLTAEKLTSVPTLLGQIKAAAEYFKEDAVFMSGLDKAIEEKNARFISSILEGALDLRIKEATEQLIKFNAHVLATLVSGVKKGEIQSYEGVTASIPEKWRDIGFVMLGGGMLNNSTIRGTFEPELRKELTSMDNADIKIIFLSSTKEQLGSEKAGIIGATLFIPEETRKSETEKNKIFIGIDVGGKSVKIGAVKYDSQGHPKIIGHIRGIAPDSKNGTDAYYKTITKSVLNLKKNLEEKGYDVSSYVGIGHPGKQKEDTTIAKDTNPNMGGGGREFEEINPAKILEDLSKLTEGGVSWECFWGNDALAQAKGGYALLSDDEKMGLAEKIGFYIGLGTGLGTGFIKTSKDANIIINARDSHVQHDPKLGELLAGSSLTKLDERSIKDLIEICGGAMTIATDKRDKFQNSMFEFHKAKKYSLVISILNKVHDQLSNQKYSSRGDLSQEPLSVFFTSKGAFSDWVIKTLLKEKATPELSSLTDLAYDYLEEVNKQYEKKVQPRSRQLKPSLPTAPIISDNYFKTRPELLKSLMSKEKLLLVIQKVLNKINKNDEIIKSEKNPYTIRRILESWKDKINIARREKREGEKDFIYKSVSCEDDLIDILFYKAPWDIMKPQVKEIYEEYLIPAMKEILGEENVNVSSALKVEKIKTSLREELGTTSSPTMAENGGINLKGINDNVSASSSASSSLDTSFFKGCIGINFKITEMREFKRSELS